MTTPAVHREVQTQALRVLDGLPPFSPVLNQLMASLGRSDASVAELARLVERDTLLSAQVLRFVNSAAYGRHRTITSVGHAISLLGLTKLRNLAMGLSVSQIWARTPGCSRLPLATFNLHAVAVAMLTDALALHLPVAHPEAAFLAGLLHDLGKLLIARGLPESYATIEMLREARVMTWHEAEREVLGTDHAALSTLALKRWGLPETVRDAVGLHHDTAGIDRREAAARPLSLARLLQSADAFINAVGIQAHAVAAELDWGAAPPLTLHGWPYERVLGDLKTEWTVVQQFFQMATGGGR